MPRRVVQPPARGLLQHAPLVAAASAPQLPPVNASWLRPLDSSARDSWRSQQKRCAEAMKAANKEAAPLDLVLYGAPLVGRLLWAVPAPLLLLGLKLLLLQVREGRPTFSAACAENFLQDALACCAAGTSLPLIPAAPLISPLPAGDSLTTLNLKSQGNAAMAAQWQRLFAGRRTLPLGMNGCTVEWLAWRIVQGGERPAQAPKVIAFLIG